MKVLILGAKGMLGTALLKIFAQETPLAWDQADVDITNEKVTIEKIKQVSPEVIINAAAYTDVDGAESARDLAFHVNEDGVRHVASAAKAIDALLVHYSTDYIFPGNHQSGYSEDDQPGPPVNVYGESKLAGEFALKEIRPRHYLLRTAWLYGTGGKNFIDTMLRLAGTSKEIQVVNDQYGNPTYTNDVAEATLNIINNKLPYGIYHTVNSGTASWYELALKIFELKGISVHINPITSSQYPLPAKRPHYSILRNTRGPALRPWSEALDDYLKER
jgi:dTDP-4-dehydrorhamnose reductase